MAANQPISTLSDKPAKELVAAYDREVRATFDGWVQTLDNLKGALREFGGRPPEPPGKADAEAQQSYIEALKSLVQWYENQFALAKSTVESLAASVTPVARLGAQVREILAAKLQLAQLQVTVVQTFPPDRVSDLTGTIGTALAGAGGLAYGLTHDFGPAIVFWAMAGAFFGFTLGFRLAHQRDWRKQWKERLGAL